MTEPTVTQADRECAASMVTKDHLAQAILTGKCDDLPAIRAIAAHRRASTAELRAGVEVLESALDKIALLSSNHGGWLENDPAKGVWDINAVANEALDSTRRQR